MSTNMTLIETKTVGAGGAANMDFQSIPATYTDLLIKWSCRNTSGRQVTFKFNNVSTNQTYRIIYGDGSAAASESGSDRIFGYSNGSTTTANTFSNGEMYIPNYLAANNKSMSGDSAEENNGSTAYMALAANLWSDTAAINRITILPQDSSNFEQYSTASLYGISNVTSTTKATGGIVSSDGTYNYHMFPYSGTFTPTQNITVDYLVIAGGGGGGYGGGGAGGLRSTVGATGGGGSLESALSLTANTGYTVTVGAGGSTSGGTGVQGGNSVFSTITSTGGGGAAYNSPTTGGSGAGSGNTAGAAGTANQGYAGGSGDGNYFGGGGGAGAVGANSANPKGGNGGAGVAISAFANATQTGVNTYYAGGGGGASANTSTSNQGLGGAGGGANATYSGKALAGIVNTGGGGAGSYASGNDNSAGGSGLVIIRYAI